VTDKKNLYEFQKELEQLINKHSIESYCDMPDFMMSEMIINIIESVGKQFKQALDWHGYDSVCHPGTEKTKSKNKNVLPIAKKVSKEWRLWHNDASQFPSDPLVSALHELDELLHGKKAGSDE